MLDHVWGGVALLPLNLPTDHSPTTSSNIYPLYFLQQAGAPARSGQLLSPLVWPRWSLGLVVHLPLGACVGLLRFSSLILQMHPILYYFPLEILIHLTSLEAL